MVVSISVLYPSEGKFDEKYYLESHMPLVWKTWKDKGLQAWKVIKVGPSPDGNKAPYQIHAILTWDNVSSFKAGSDANGAEIFGDIPNFTDVQPTILIGEDIGQSS